MQNHRKFELNSTYICPICSGIIRQANSDKLMLRCHDCNNVFEAIDNGHTDTTNIYELVFVGDSV